MPLPKPKPKNDDRGGDRIVAVAKPKPIVKAPAPASNDRGGDRIVAAPKKVTVVNTVRPPLPVVKPKAPPSNDRGGDRIKVKAPTPKGFPVYGAPVSDRGSDRIKVPVKYTAQDLPIYRGAAPVVPPPVDKPSGYSSIATKTKTQFDRDEFSPVVKPTPEQVYSDRGGDRIRNPVLPNPTPPLRKDGGLPISMPDEGPARIKGAQQYADMVTAFAKGGRAAVDNMPNYTGMNPLTGLGLPDTIKNYASRAQEPIREAALQRLAAQDDYFTQMNYMDGDEMIKQLGQGMAEIGLFAGTGALWGLAGGPLAPATVPAGAIAGTFIGSLVAIADLLLSGEVDPRKDARQAMVDERNRMLGLPDRADPNRRIGGLLSGTPSFIPSMDRMLFGVPANELKGDNFTGPPGSLSTYFPQRDNPQFPPPATPLPSTGMTPADLIAWANSIRTQVNTKTGFSGKLEDPATAPNPAYVPKPPAAATTPAPIVPLGSPAAPAAPAPEPGGGGDSGDGMSEFEKLAQLMEIGKYARQPVPEDRTRENELYNMLQESQNQMQALQQQYIEALIKQLNTQPQMGIPAPVGPGAPAAAAGNMYSLGGIPRVAATGSNLQFSNAGLGYLNSIDPSLLQALMQYLKAMNYTGQGQMGSFGEMNYARQGGLGSLLQSDASFENPLAYAGLTPQMREPAEAGLRSLFAQMGLMG